MAAFFGSMRGRVFLVLVGGIVASVFLTVTLADREGRYSFAHLRESHIAERVKQLVATLEAIPPQNRPSLLATLGPGMRAEVGAMRLDAGQRNAELTEALTDRLGQQRHIAATRGSASDCAALAEGASHAQHADAGACQVVWLDLVDGTPVRVVVRSGPDSPWELDRPWLLFYVLLLPLCLVVLAYVVARMATAPLGKLGAAAAEFGRDIDRPPLPERGPSEVRAAAAAFNAMQSRIRSHLRERTQMLAAVAHDLQTPLTRLRLRLEQVPAEDLRAKLVGDLEAMQSMIREGLEFARSSDAGATTRRVDLDSLLATVCADAVDAGQDVSLSGRTGASITVDAGALQRAITNLIDNAVKYGGFARVTATREGRQVVVRVRDGGPGIPPAQLEAVFDPFYRLETSRSRETGGTGLGLTIARNIVQRYGGALTLRNHPDGGLEAVLTLTPEPAAPGIGGPKELNPATAVPPGTAKS